MTDTTELVRLTLDKNPIEFQNKLETMLGQRAMDALEAKRVEVAQSIYADPDDSADDDDQDEFDFDSDLDDLDLGDLDDDE